jgi:hypothetical protein
VRVFQAGCQDPAANSQAIRGYALSLMEWAANSAPPPSL